MIAAVGQLFARVGGGEIHFRGSVDSELGWRLETGGQDADDPVRFAIEQNRVADRLRGRAHALLPELVRDDRDRVGAGPVFLLQKGSALHGQHFENGKVVPGDGFS